MLTFSPPLRALLGAARDIAASVIAPAADTERRTARRPAPATFALAEAHLLSATISAGPVPTATRSPSFTMVSGA
ncbi:MAG TPA: hypothetical protein VL100_08180 [Croceibacterium sp.]|nr:hypothetical protein [Croceibacterium sp.]